MTVVYSVVPNSTFLDAYANQQATPDQFSTIADPKSFGDVQRVLGDLFAKDGNAAAVAPATTDMVTVALVLNRPHNDDLTNLLASDWSARQLALADQDAIWAKYGADSGTYNTVQSAIEAVITDAPLNAAQAAGYLSTPQDRTIWLTLDATQFQQLFGTEMLAVTLSGQNSSFPAWSGNLNLPSEIASEISGLWVDQGVRIAEPAKLNTEKVEPSPLEGGFLGIGNGHPGGSVASPAEIAANYSFPLPAGLTGPIALIEASLPQSDQADLLTNYNLYRKHFDLVEMKQEDFSVFDLNYAYLSSQSELTLDISVIAGAAPTSSLQIYSYLASLGDSDIPSGTAFNAYQRAFFDPNNAGVLSSSYPVGSQPTATSPFQWAWQQLFLDGALRNVSVHVSAGDQGSSGDIGNGVANVPNSQAAPTALVVGGTSIADRHTAQHEDVTLSDMADKALAGEAKTIFSLVASGLRTLPANLPDIKADDPWIPLASMFETVWQRLELTYRHDRYESDFGNNLTGLGGVADGVPIPDYQSAFGLTPTSPYGTTGRGTPDVSALAGGDYFYSVLNSKYGEANEPLVTKDGGTSAATPLWASLTAHFNAVFADQHLPQLGFYNDLLYTAATIVPASFNDILLGNNIDSFHKVDSSDYYNPDGKFYFVPTGQGYTAEASYDLASGLGSPDGLVLARTLTAIAHAQISSTAPAVVTVVDEHTGTSTMAQTLLVQNNYHKAGGVLVQVDGTTAVEMGDNSDLGWTSRLAGQVVQGDNFDSDLVTLLDGGAKSTPYEITVQAGATLGVSADGHDLKFYQELLTNDYGFIQFGDVQHNITLARPVAIAQTAGGASDQNAVLRIRQNGGDDAQLEVYRVDDLNGTVKGYAPGDSQYAEEAAKRDYHLVGGGKVIDGPGWGNFMQVEIEGVNPGDFVALKYTNMTTNDIYWAFSQGNAGNATAIYNYGLNTWGFEDRPLTGDHDFQDLVVQIDFTSASGHGLLV